MDDGDERFDALVEAHRASLHRYVVRRVPAADAEDVLAEAFATAWRHRHALPDPPTLWLYRAAWHAVLHHFRAQRRRDGLVAKLVSTYVPTDPGYDESPASDIVSEAMRDLSRADQEVLRLAYWEQLDTSEIAWVLDTSLGAARVRLHRARQRLARHLPALPTERQPRSDPGPPPARRTTQPGPFLSVATAQELAR